MSEYPEGAAGQATNVPGTADYLDLRQHTANALAIPRPGDRVHYRSNTGVYVAAISTGPTPADRDGGTYGLMVNVPGTRTDVFTTASYKQDCGGPGTFALAMPPIPAFKGMLHTAPGEDAITQRLGADSERNHPRWLESLVGTDAANRDWNLRRIVKEVTAEALRPVLLMQEEMSAGWRAFDRGRQHADLCALTRDVEAVGVRPEPRRVASIDHQVDTGVQLVDRLSVVERRLADLAGRVTGCYREPSPCDLPGFDGAAGHAEALQEVQQRQLDGLAEYLDLLERYAGCGDGGPQGASGPRAGFPTRADGVRTR